MPGETMKYERNKAIVDEPFTNETLKAVRQISGLTQKEMASMLNLSKRTYEGYEQGKSKIPGPVERLVSLLFGRKDDEAL